MRLPPFRIERYFDRHEFSAPALLCASDCEAMRVGEVLALEPGAAAAFQATWLGYTESPGAPSLRAAIAATYRTIEPEQILVHTGAEEAIFTFANGVLEPGDHVVVQVPCYQSLNALPAAAGCEVTAWQCREAEGWAPDLEALRQAVRPRTRAVMINAPHNPTGYLFPPAAFEAIVELCRSNGMILFSDEVYRGLEHDPADRLPAACERYEHAVSLGVMSKAYGLGGLRIGWVATRDPGLRQAMAGVRDYTTICNSAPSEFLATLVLRHGDTVVARNLEIIRSNLELLDRFFEAHADRLDWHRPKAGPIAFPALKRGLSAQAFCAEVLAKAGALLLPAPIFDWGDRHFRLGFGRNDLPAALERLDAYLSAKGN